MIFFLCHYWASPVWSAKNLRFKGQVKLALVLLALLCFCCTTASSTTAQTAAQRLLLAELILDAICFSFLLVYSA